MSTPDEIVSRFMARQPKSGMDNSDRCYGVMQLTRLGIDTNRLVYANSRSDCVTADMRPDRDKPFAIIIKPK